MSSTSKPNHKLSEIEDELDLAEEEMAQAKEALERAQARKTEKRQQSKRWG